ncbi:MAG: hypothetical protein ACKOSS_07060 [Planctomycetia bacterium]
MSPSPATPHPLEPRPPGRPSRHGRVAFALRTMRRSPLMRWTAVTTFLCWGGLLGLVAFGRVSLLQGGQLSLLSLGAWFFLLWWFPIIESTGAFLARDPRRAWVAVGLEWLAVGGVALVHLLLAVMVVVLARS